MDAKGSSFVMEAEYDQVPKNSYKTGEIQATQLFNTPLKTNDAYNTCRLLHIIGIIMLKNRANKKVHVYVSNNKQYKFH